MPAQPKELPRFTIQLAHLEALMVLTHHIVYPRPRYRVSFTANESARQQAINLIIDSMALLHHLAPEVYVDYPKREGIMRKLYAHLNRAGIQTPQAIHDFTPDALAAITYIAAHPHLADAPANLASILKRTASGSSSKLKLPPDTPPRPVIWRHPDGVHTLTELNHPCHLMEEGHFLHHCISRHYHEILLEEAGLQRSTPSGATCLNYWLTIENNQSRLFSLCSNGEPRVTINYRISSRALAEFGPRSPLLGDEPFFPALIDAVVHLATAMKPLYLERFTFQCEPLIDALTQRVSSDAPRRFLYPHYQLVLI